MAPKTLIHYTLAQKRALSVATLRLRLLRSCGTLQTYQLAQCLTECAVQDVPTQDVVTMIDTVFDDERARLPTATIGAALSLARDITQTRRGTMTALPARHI